MTYHVTLFTFSPFQIILDLILSKKINSDLLPIASSTLYVLISCYQVRKHAENSKHEIKLIISSPQTTYHELVTYLIASQADPVNKQRLTEAFTELTANLPLTADRINRIKFRDNFEKFIVNVRGFLLVK